MKTQNRNTWNKPNLSEQLNLLKENEKLKAVDRKIRREERTLEDSRKRSAKIKNTKRKKNIKRLREEAEQFLHHITEIELHFNDSGYASSLFDDKHNRVKHDPHKNGKYENVPIDGTDISIEYLKAWTRLEKVVKESVTKITI
jgi:NADPH-dependent glutamate synthase beta subunit-like oxidoreductase